MKKAELQDQLDAHNECVINLTRALGEGAFYIKSLKDALSRARVLVAMDTLPENVPDEGQRRVAEELLEIIDALLPEE